MMQNIWDDKAKAQYTEQRPVKSRERICLSMGLRSGWRFPVSIAHWKPGICEATYAAKGLRLPLHAWYTWWKYLI